MCAELMEAKKHLHHVLQEIIHDAGEKLILPPSYVPSFAAHHGMVVGAGPLFHSAVWRVAHPVDLSSHEKPPVPRVMFVAAAFALIFTAYNVAQTFLTTLFPKFGFYSFAVIYIFFAMGSIVAPAVGAVAGLTPSMAMGAVAYVGMIVCFLADNGLILLLVCLNIRSFFLQETDVCYLRHVKSRDRYRGIDPNARRCPPSTGWAAQCCGSTKAYG